MVLRQGTSRGENGLVTLDSGVEGTQLTLPSELKQPVDTASHETSRGENAEK